MTPGQDKTTKAFFKDHWRQPVRRLGKIIMPIACACAISVMGLFLFYYFIPFLIPQLMSFLYQPYLTHPLDVLSHCVCAVVMGIIVAIGGGAMHRHYQSRFHLVQLKMTGRRKIL